MSQEHTVRLTHCWEAKCGCKAEEKAASVAHFLATSDQFYDWPARSAGTFFSFAQKI